MKKLMDDTNALDALLARAMMRCKSLCLEEYLVNRDLRCGLPWHKKFFDPIVMVEKHPMLCSFACNVSHRVFAKSIILVSICIALASSAVMYLLFPFASDIAMIVFFMLYMFSCSCAITAYMFLLYDGKVALNLADVVLRQ